MSWSLGRPDGQNLTRAEMIEAVARIVAAVEACRAAALLSSEREQTRRMNEELHAAAVQEAQRVMDDARARTRQILEHGRHQITSLRGHREQLITQLNAAHQELQRVVRGLVPLSEPERPE